MSLWISGSIPLNELVNIYLQAGYLLLALFLVIQVTSQSFKLILEIILTG